MISPIHLQAIADATATGIVIYIAGGIPIALLAWAALRVWRRHGSRARFAVLYSALLAISSLPLIEWVHRGAVRSTSGGFSHPLITISSSWAIFAFTVWGICATIALLRVAAGLVRLRRLRQNCRSIAITSLDPLLQQTLRELHCPRAVQICVSDELPVPTAIGFFKPLVILPAWALQDLSSSELRPVLLHELAHVGRWDDWTNLLQKLIQAMLFFHPAVWWIEKRISLEREMACDDIVLAHTGNRRAYAQSLLFVAERSFVRRGFSLAQAAVSRVRQTSARIAQILEVRQPGKIGIWKPVSLLLAGSFALGFVILPRLPNIVTFSDKTPVAVTADAKQLPANPLEASTPLVASASPLSRRIAHAASFQTKRTFAPTRNEGQNVLGHNMIEAKFARNERYTSPLQRKNAAVSGPAFIQTLFVVTRFQGNGQSSEFWTIRVWKLTVFTPAAAAQNTLPAKKV